MSHRLKPGQYLVLLAVMFSASLGDSCLKRGMTLLPPISLAHPGALIAAVFTPWIAVGIALLICFFASYLTALSWADLTFVLPATAFGNVVMVFVSAIWLHEHVSWQRWLGVFLITAAVGFVAQGPSLTTHPDPNAAQHPAPAPPASEPS
jgi:multidrug transporter EmrE-like cation transporter